MFYFDNVQRRRSAQRDALHFSWRPFWPFRYEGYQTEWNEKKLENIKYLCRYKVKS